MLVRVTQKILLIQKRICFLLGEIKFFKYFWEMEDFAKARLEKDLAELKKLIDTHFAQVSFMIWMATPYNFIFSVKKMKKNLMYWNHKLTKEKMFVQNKLKNAPENNKKKWNAKRFAVIIGISNFELLQIQLTTSNFANFDQFLTLFIFRNFYPLD